MKTVLKKLSSVLTSLLLVLTFATLIGAAQAAVDIPEVTSAISTTDLSADLLQLEDKPSEAFSTPFREAVVGIINYILTFVGLITVLVIIYAGFLLMTDVEKEDDAKKMIKFAIIGIVLILLSFAIVRVVVDVKTNIA